MWIMCAVAVAAFYSTAITQGKQRMVAACTRACRSRKLLATIAFPWFSTENTLLYNYYNLKQS